jgi:hypothetical protein
MALALLNRNGGWLLDSGPANRIQARRAMMNSVGIRQRRTQMQAFEGS